MNSAVNKMLNAYGQVQVNVGISSASPHQLIAMLYDGALTAIANAKVQLQCGNIGARGAALSKAIAIIDEGLKVSLDVEAGGDIAQNLRALYEYMSQRLLHANLKADASALEEVERLLLELKTAWDAIGGTAAQVASVQPVEVPPKVAASYGKF